MARHHARPRLRSPARSRTRSWLLGLTPGIPPPRGGCGHRRVGARPARRAGRRPPGLRRPAFPGLDHRPHRPVLAPLACGSAPRGRTLRGPGRRGRPRNRPAVKPRRRSGSRRPGGAPVAPGRGRVPSGRRRGGDRGRGAPAPAGRGSGRDGVGPSRPNASRTAAAGRPPCERCRPHRVWLHVSWPRTRRHATGDRILIFRSRVPREGWIGPCSARRAERAAASAACRAGGDPASTVAMDRGRYGARRDVVPERDRAGRVGGEGRLRP